MFTEWHNRQTNKEKYVKVDKSSLHNPIKNLALKRLN